MRRGRENTVLLQQHVGGGDWGNGVHGVVMSVRTPRRVSVSHPAPEAWRIRMGKGSWGHMGGKGDNGAHVDKNNVR